MADTNAFKEYFGTGESPTVEEITSSLWNPDVDATSYGGQHHYQTAILEQYKIYVEMADRVSARRALANTFFLSLNTLIFTGLAALWRDRPTAGHWMLLFPLAVLIVQCATWFWIVRSYRQLNAGKFSVVGALEQRLPASPYWSAEWKALGEGRDRARYWPLTHVEQIVPALFAATYLSAFVAAMLV